MKKNIVLTTILTSLLFFLTACQSAPVPENETISTPEPTVHVHAWSKWQTATEPTCTESGIQTRTCVCGESEQKALATPGHLWVIDAAVAPTCTTEGLTEGMHCSVCNTVLLAQTPVAKTDHTIAIAPNTAQSSESKLVYSEYCSACDMHFHEQAEISFAKGTITEEETIIQTKHLDFVYLNRIQQLVHQ